MRHRSADRPLGIAAASLAAIALGVLASGCGGGSSGSSPAPGSAASASTHASNPAPRSTPARAKRPQPNPPKPKPKPKPKPQLKNASASDFAPALFGNPTAVQNPYFPLRPGTQWVRQGHVNVGSRSLPHQVVTTVTGVSKEIDGVPALAVIDQDTNGGEIAEQSIDWLATDRSGNVWDLGSYTETYEGGQFITATDAWLAGTNGATAGIWMLADPRTGTPSYVEDTVPGIEEPTAQVEATGLRKCVPYKCYHDVISIREGGEHKYFARGVGQIQTEPPAGGLKQEVENLINLRDLTPAGLRQMDNLALKLDQHARSVAPTVYGASKPARRGV